MLAVVPFLAYVTWTLTIPASVDAGCTISIRYPGGDLKEPQPLILTWKNTSFLYPKNDDEILRIHTGDTIYLACPGKNNYLNNELWGSEAEVTCVRNKLFRVSTNDRSQGGLYEFSALVCAKSPTDITRKNLKTTAQGGICSHTSVDIGFKVSNTFIPTFEICRDDSRYMTYFAKSRITSHIGNLQKSYPRPQFKQGTFYKGISVDNLYQFNTQKEMLTRILGSSELVEERLQKSVQYLARGHLVAKTDFVYGSQQNSTFWFLNVAPQWQTFNNGNWKWLENSVKDFASKRRLELDVYTGVHGQMTMEDIDGVQKRIYLFPEDEILPVPRYHRSDQLGKMVS
ncbi:uncharacterized protein LOC116850195 isoform X2 [Odontomachus brunneus]|uniref:uncharacterized protein LOC116850195 isoform X2 n=1 Tax=Odontomachus brunneus TaxID=486640 RepID=UPI0013F258C6|nr:uncharacterized protein LOC116850195 isoform X2 [Odontomachus brunneus]